jgi:hypothetical protein
MLELIVWCRGGRIKGLLVWFLEKHSVRRWDSMSREFVHKTVKPAADSARYQSITIIQLGQLAVRLTDIVGLS